MQILQLSIFIYLLYFCIYGYYYVGDQTAGNLAFSLVTTCTGYHVYITSILTHILMHAHLHVCAKR